MGAPTLGTGMQVLEQREPMSAFGGLPPALRAIELASYREDLRRFARRRVRDEALAEDAVQDALEAALVSLPRFQGNSSLKTWLMGILAHKIQDAFRRETRYVRLAVPDGEEVPTSGEESAWGSEAIHHCDPLREVCRRRFSAAVRAAIEQLPASLREVLQLLAIEGLATEEVCRRLGITEGNCWVRLHRARKMLSARLRDHY